MEKKRIVRSKCLAGALVWLGFEYNLDEEGNHVFVRTSSFDLAWKDLHAMKSFQERYRK